MSRGAGSTTVPIVTGDDRRTARLGLALACLYRPGSPGWWLSGAGEGMMRAELGNSPWTGFAERLG